MQDIKDYKRAKPLMIYLKGKKLRYREDILDNMNEDELVANLFRINQTKQKLLKDNVQCEKEAKDLHYEVGKKLEKQSQILVE